MGAPVALETQPYSGPEHGDEMVYVVDDDEGVCHALRRLLASAGLRAETFTSAEAFLARARPDQPSCLVLDLYLGNGHGGLHLQAQLGEQQPTIPIIFITGGGDIRASVRAMKAGALDLLEKPVDHEALLASVRAALALSRQRAQAQGGQDDRVPQLRLGHPTACIAAARPAEIQRIYVDAPWHGGGIAQALMAAMLEHARIAGADRVWLGVWERNPRARRFYEKSGFAIAGDHAFVLGREVQRDLVMARVP